VVTSVGDLPFGEGQDLVDGDTFTKEVLVGLIPPRLDCGCGVPGWSLLDQ